LCKTVEMCRVAEAPRRRTAYSWDVGTGIEHEKKGGVRVILAFEDGFDTYQGMLVAALRILRPDAEVLTVEPGEIGGAARRFSPHVVIGGPFEEAEVRDVPAWVELSLDPIRSTRVKVDGEYAEMVNPSLDKLLAIIERAAPRPHG
jgi:hypothetical protein